MYRKKRSLIALSLCILMVLSVFAACGPKETGSQEKSGSISTQGPVNEPPMKLRLLGHDTGRKYVKFEDREEYPVWKEVKKLFDAANLELEYELVPLEQYDVTIKTRMASGGDLPDVVNITQLDNTTVLNLAKQGVIVELNSLIDQYSNGNIKNMYEKEFPYAKQLTTSPEGKMYWFSNMHKKTYNKTEPAPVALTMMIRKDWLEKLGIPVPTTAQEYVDALKKMREQDANSNDLKDEIILYDPSTFLAPIAQWFGLGTGITAVDVENKKVVSPWYQEGIKEYFRFLQQLVKEGLIDTSLIGAQYEQVQQKITENKAASQSAYNLQTDIEPTIQGGGELLPLMPLKALDHIQPAAQLEPPFLVWRKYAITKNCKNPKAAIAFFDVVYSREYADLAFWGIEGLTYKKNDSGANVFINNEPEEELAKLRKATGNQIFGDTVFPRLQFSNLEYELDPARVPQHKIDHQLKVMNYKPYFVNMNDNFLAIPDDKQLETKTKLLNNLTTYSAELATKLALGQKPLDDWDKYIAELKKIGLDDLIKIDQELLDRYNSLGSK